MKSYEESHQEYKVLLQLWQRCRHLYQGEDAVKRNAYAQAYLPKPNDMKDWAYNSYVSRASLPGIFESTINGRLGDIFRKPPILKAPDNVMEWVQKGVNRYDEGLDIIATRILREIMITGRVAAVLDFDEDRDSHVISLYGAEDIINWNEDRETLSITVREFEYDDESHKIQILYEMSMVDGYFEVNVHRQVNEGKWETTKREPTMGGRKLDFFPVVVVNSEKLGLECNDPPMLSLSNLLLSFFRNSADYEQGLHAIGVPTPIVSGIRKEDAKFSLGPYTPMVLEPPDAKGYYLEFGGAGMNHLKEAMEEKLTQALMMGARLLQPRRQVESAEAARTRMGAETSLLNNLTRVTEAGVEILLKMWIFWQTNISVETLTQEITYELNRDYIEEKFDPNVLKIINESELAGLISPQVCFELRKKFEVYPAGMSFEEEKDMLETTNSLTAV